MSSTYHIVYPRGDRSKICVVEIVDALSYELSDYALASRNSFTDPDEAVAYAKELAKTHNIKYEHGSLSSSGINDYLD